MKLNSLLLLPLLLFAFFATSCLDTQTTAEQYADWKTKNEAYFNSYNDSVGYNKLTIPANRGGGIVLYKVLKEGDATSGSPMYNDTVIVHYRGKLIDGTIFDESYEGDTAVWDNNENPRSFALDRVVKGWTESFMQMHIGEKRRIIIPWTLGYGESGKGTILPYTTLIFDVKLISFGKPKSN